MKKDLIYAILQEIELQKNFKLDTIETIYFGGGTPSVLSANEVELIINKIEQTFQSVDIHEITFEANPEDINSTYLSELKNLGINRISLGSQTFDDHILTTLNRNHGSRQTLSAIEQIISSGIRDTSIDLMFGLPGSTIETIKTDLNYITQILPSHVSAYWLTIEDKTVFGNLANKKILKELPEPLIIQQWDLIRDTLQSNHYQQYEISNYGYKNNIAKHNTNYWKGKSYLGIGPSAHSFDGQNRYWNIKKQC